MKKERPAWTRPSRPYTPCAPPSTSPPGLDPFGSTRRSLWMPRTLWRTSSPPARHLKSSHYLSHLGMARHGHPSSAPSAPRYAVVRSTSAAGSTSHSVVPVSTAVRSLSLSLVASFVPTGARAQTDVFTAALYDALRSCISLRSLTVRYDGIYEIGRPGSPRFIDGLIALLATPAFPSLETLALDVRAATFTSFVDVARSRAGRLADALENCCASLSLRARWLAIDWASIGMDGEEMSRAAQLAALKEIFASCRKGGRRVDIEIGGE